MNFKKNSNRNLFENYSYWIRIHETIKLWANKWLISIKPNNIVLIVSIWKTEESNKEMCNVIRD